MMNDVCAMAQKAAEKLREEAAMLERCPPPNVLGPWVIGFATIENDHRAMIDEIADAIPAGGDRCIYTFEVTDKAPIAHLKAAIQALKAEKPQPFASPRYNEGSDSRFLYVGSSFATKNRRQTLSSRLKQHLGLSNTTTYAMHLDRWARELPGGVKITAFQYPAVVGREAILAIEDSLARECQPLLGRRGRAL